MDLPRPLWRDLVASLQRYSPLAAEVAARDWIDEFLPAVRRGEKGRLWLPDQDLYQRRLDVILRRELGAWYGHGRWRVGNESFGGCFCHGFLREYATGARVDGVRRAARWVSDELDAMARCLGALGQAFTLFDGGGDPAERAVRLSLAIEHVIDAVHDGTAGAGAWDAYVCDAVAWLFEHHGIAQPRALVDMVGQTLGPLCDGPDAPPPPERHRACDDLASAVVLATL
jgi:hypothetical protein